ncbi:MAG: hypothetical protein WDA09_08785 [Bacteriovoracaceae bacterium]
MEKAVISQQQIVNQLLRMPHGDLKVYADIGLKAAKHEAELFAHLIAWNEINGTIRDSKVAFPVFALRGERDDELFENAAAHLCKLSPKDLLRASRFHKELGPHDLNGGGAWLKKAIRMYLKTREENRGWWDSTALQHRNSMKSLYAMHHIVPGQRAQKVLFEKEYPRGSIFEAVAELKHMNPQEAAGTILNRKIPYLVAVGALGGIKGKTDIVLALIERMTGQELITNTNMLQKMGVFENSALRASYEAALERMKRDKKTTTLKAEKAAQAIQKADKKTAQKIQRAQEEKIDNSKGIQGNWLVLGDKSGSMSSAIEVARNLSAVIARAVKDEVHLIFFNREPTYFNVTGKSLEEIRELTRRQYSGGGTSVGVGLDYLREKKIIVNGIAICTDGEENSLPLFYRAYQKYSEELGINPTVYLFLVPGNDVVENKCRRAGIPITVFKNAHKMDYYSLENIAKTLRTSRYSLLEEIMETPLLTMAEVFKKQL